MHFWAGSRIHYHGPSRGHYDRVTARLTPSWVSGEGKPQPGYIFVNLGYSFLAAAVGGYVAAWLAVANPLTTCSRWASLCWRCRVECVCNPRARANWYQLVCSPDADHVLAGGLVPPTE